MKAGLLLGGKEKSEEDGSERATGGLKAILKVYWAHDSVPLKVWLLN